MKDCKLLLYHLNLSKLINYMKLNNNLILYEAIYVAVSCSFFLHLTLKNPATDI